MPSIFGDDWWRYDGNAILGISKGGWDCLWVEYGKQVDAASKRLTKTPLAVHVEQVYRFGDFSLLGIGV